MAFDVPRGVMLPIDDVEVRLDPAPHPFEIEHAAAIEDNWHREKTAKPALYDGRMVLLSALSLRGTRLEGQCHTIRFATFLHWRRHRASANAEHAYAHAALVSSDNALVAIRMGAHTVGAGQVYFAAGSFEPMDFKDGLVDLHFNMAREVKEETGVDLDGLQRDTNYRIWSENAGTAIFRRYHLDDTADSIAARIRRFVAADADPEIEGPVVIRHAEDLPEGLAAHMLPIVRWHFSQGRN